MLLLESIKQDYFAIFVGQFADFWTQDLLKKAFAIHPSETSAYQNSICGDYVIVDGRPVRGRLLSYCNIV